MLCQMGTEIKKKEKREEKGRRGFVLRLPFLDKCVLDKCILGRRFISSVPFCLFSPDPFSSCPFS